MSQPLTAAPQTAPDTAPLLSVRNLSRHFGAGAPAVGDLSLELQPGEILALIGPSGCGKTTTLRMIGGFETPDAGEVWLSGRDVTRLAPERRGIGMVFQDYALFPHMDVAANIAFGAKEPGAVERYLAMVGLAGFGARYPDELSGGQQQRVALARSFAAKPGLILLDEPFSNLDAALRGATRREIRALLKGSGIGIVFVTHDQEEALSFADRIAVMSGGRLLQTGSAAEVYDHPVNAFVAGFLGRTNLIPGEAAGASATTPLGPLPLARPASGPVTLSLRPEQLRLVPASGGATSGTPETAAITGTITGAEFKGHDMTYWVSLGGIELQIDAMQPERLAPGSTVGIEVRGSAVALSG